MSVVATAGGVPNKRAVLASSVLASIILSLDTTAVGIALPAIGASLNAGLATQQWILNAYLLMLGSLLLLGGSLGDRFSLRRVFAIGVIAFEVASLLCAFAPNAGLLIVGRGVQGMAGALLVPTTLALITATFPERELGRAFGLWTSLSSLALIFGPLAGGVLVSALSWRWVFAMHLVIGLALLWLVRSLGSQISVPQPGVRVDVPGAALVTLGLAGPAFALIQGPQLGWGHPLVLTALIAGIAFFGTFLLYEHRARHPMLPLGLFRIRNFAASNAATLFVYGAMNAFAVYTILYVQQVAGYGALLAALALTPTMIMVFLLPQPLGALADRFGPRPFTTAGSFVAGTGLLLLLRVEAEMSYVSGLLPGLILFGVGMAAVASPLTATALGSVSPERGSLASGVNNAIARVAGLLAIAVVGAVISAQYASVVDRELPESLAPETRQAVAEAKASSLGGDASEVPASQQQEVSAAFGEASQSAYRLGMGLSAALLFAGGLVSAAGIRTAHDNKGENNVRG